MKTQYFVLFTLCLLLSLSTFAQSNGRMETDRPDQTESPYITKQRFLQAEFGFNYERVDGQTQWVHPTVLWKYGLDKRFEFRLITELQSAGGESGLLPIQIGGKVSLLEEKGLTPKTSLIAHVGIPEIGQPAFKISKWAPNFRFTFQNTLSEQAALGYNFGAEWDGASNTPDWIYTFAPGINVGENGYAYVEAYGSVRKGSSPKHSLAGGVAYYLSDDTKLDFSGSYGLTKAATDFYLAIGFSFRAPTATKRISAKPAKSFARY